VVGQVVDMVGQPAPFLTGATPPPFTRFSPHFRNKGTSRRTRLRGESERDAAGAMGGGGGGFPVPTWYFALFQEKLDRPRGCPFLAASRWQIL